MKYFVIELTEDDTDEDSNELLTWDSDGLSALPDSWKIKSSLQSCISYINDRFYRKRGCWAFDICTLDDSGKLLGIETYTKE